MVLPLLWAARSLSRPLSRPWRGTSRCCLVAQRNAADDNPGVDDFYQVGTVANILQLLKLPDGTIKVLVEGDFALL